MKCLYIDDGPYMPTLEHLIQHYQRFSDGLPVNLRHAVPPKPKPPLPLFSTIPKSARIKHVALPGDVVSPKSAPKPVPPPAKRHMSIPSDALMNTVGLLSPPSVSPLSTSPTASAHKESRSMDILNFRSLKLKSPKKNIIIDGVKSLKKAKKSKKSVSDGSEGASPPLIADLSLSLRNLSFSSDLIPIASGVGGALHTAASAATVSDDLYNVPTNNAAVTPTESAAVSLLLLDDSLPPEHSPPPPPQNVTSSATVEYFTESDYSATRDKDAEEIYFIDAPKIAAGVAGVGRPPSIAYTPFKIVPYFPDGTEIPQPSKVCTH